MTRKQRSLFDDDPAPWQEDDESEHSVAAILFPTGPDRPFDYVVPDSLRDDVDPGRRVRVPFGRGDRLVTGYCIDVQTKPVGPRRLKEVRDVVDPRPLISPSMLRLTQWIAHRYLCPWGQVLEAVVPAGVRGQAGTRLTTLLSVAPEKTPEKAPEQPKKKLPPKQARVMSILRAATSALTPAQLAHMAECTQAPITALRRKGLIRSRTERLRTDTPIEVITDRESDLKLNDDQQRALAAILESLHSQQHQTVLIHGVTGSGKTEVYIQAIQEVIGFGRQAIVLVPEISLTPQTRRRFRRRFDRVAVLHSHLSDSERHLHWQQIASGEVQVVVGARSAIFAPTPRLGLIVLDEEHESTFKQATAPRYHARDVAIARAAAEDVPLVLGSATPSLDAWHRARTGEYRLVEMPRRVFNRPMPSVGTIDLRDEAHNRRSRGSISRQLHAAMHEALRDDGQILLLLNRRGFSTHIQCPACGDVVRCPDCDIALTHHRHGEIALCHYCDYQIPPPGQCPSCQFAGIRYGGLGTQRLESEVRGRFPGVQCLRMDSDTMRRPGSHEKALEAFRSGEVKILLGTQMIAKGLDFPNVTLVGVINADMALHLPDFRAAERTFHLITQVAGRTGRGDKGGRVLVQTFNPDHPAVLAAARHDYARFAAEELPIREMLSYPPFASMIRLVIRGPSEEVTGQFASHLGELLTAALERHEACARVLGPAPAPLAKLRGLFRFQIQIQGPDPERLRDAVAEVVDSKLSPPERVQWIVDVDPLDML